LPEFAQRPADAEAVAGVTRRLGRQGAAWLIMTGARISARTALRWGLIDEITD